MSHDYYCWLFPARPLSKQEAFRSWSSILQDFQASSVSPASAPDERAEILALKLRGQEVDFWVHSLGPDQNVKVAVMSVAEYSVAPHRLDFVKDLFRVIDRLHMELQSKRTIFGWELGESVEFNAAEEYEALGQGRVRGLYWLDILASQLMDPDRLKSLEDSAAKSPDVEFARLANGDYKFRHALKVLAGY